MGERRSNSSTPATSAISTSARTAEGLAHVGTHPFAKASRRRAASAARRSGDVASWFRCRTRAPRRPSRPRHACRRATSNPRAPSTETRAARRARGARVARSPGHVHRCRSKRVRASSHAPAARARCGHPRRRRVFWAASSSSRLRALATAWWRGASPTSTGVPPAAVTASHTGPGSSRVTRIVGIPLGCAEFAAGVASSVGIDRPACSRRSAAGNGAFREVHVLGSPLGGGRAELRARDHGGGRRMGSRTVEPGTRERLT